MTPDELELLELLEELEELLELAPLLDEPEELELPVLLEPLFLLPESQADNRLREPSTAARAKTEKNLRIHLPMGPLAALGRQLYEKATFASIFHPAIPALKTTPSLCAVWSWIPMA